MCPLYAYNIKKVYVNNFVIKGGDYPQAYSDLSLYIDPAIAGIILQTEEEDEDEDLLPRWLRRKDLAWFEYGTHRGIF